MLAGDARLFHQLPPQLCFRPVGNTEPSSLFPLTDSPGGILVTNFRLVYSNGKKHAIFDQPMNGVQAELYIDPHAVCFGLMWTVVFCLFLLLGH